MVLLAPAASFKSGPAFIRDESLLRLRSAAGRRLVFTAHPVLPARLHFRLQFFELLLLLIVESRLEPGPAVLLDCHGFRAAILAGKRLILEECLHLLLAVHQNRFDLVLLIGGEIQRLAQMLELTVGIHRPAMSVAPLALLLAAAGLGLILRRGWSGALILRVESGVRAEREQAAECNGEKFVSHGYLGTSSC